MLEVKEKIKCSNRECGRMFTPHYDFRTNILKSKTCPGCQYKNADKKRKQASKNESLNNRKNSKSFNLYTTVAWKWFSHYVLAYYANNDGIVKCCTSGRLYHIKSRKLHCGHYIKVNDGSKTNYSVCLDFRNVGPQSMQDNTYNGGRPDVMRKWLIEKHGLEAIEALEIKKHNICKPDPIWLAEIATEYRIKYKNLLKERGVEDYWKRKK